MKLVLDEECYPELEQDLPSFWGCSSPTFGLQPLTEGLERGDISIPLHSDGLSSAFAFSGIENFSHLPPVNLFFSILFLKETLSLTLERWRVMPQPRRAQCHR